MQRGFLFAENGLVDIAPLTSLLIYIKILIVIYIPLGTNE